MTPHWKDLHTVKDRQWVGLEFTVEPRPRPSWRVEAALPYHIRLTRAGQPLLWARMATGYTGLRWLLGTGDHPSVLPPLEASEVQARIRDPGSPTWFAAWARHFTRALDEAPHSPLHAGTWRLMRAGPFMPGTSWPPDIEALCPDIVDDLEKGGPRAVTRFEHYGINVRTPLLGLRLEQHLSPSRLKVWRKRARDGTLPPVLALHVSPLCAYVVLDGHHRWRAALDEQRPIPLLTLSSIQRRTHTGGTDPREHQRVERIFLEGMASPGSHDQGTPQPLPVVRLNEMALRAWDNRPALSSRTRAWLHPGGLSAWRAEVRERLAGLEDAVPSEFTEAFLASGPGRSEPSR